jgi:hypothetical protein
MVAKERLLRYCEELGMRGFKIPEPCRQRRVDDFRAELTLAGLGVPVPPLQCYRSACASPKPKLALDVPTKHFNVGPVL